MSYTLPTKSYLEKIIAAFNPDDPAYKDMRAKEYPGNLPDGAALQRYGESRTQPEFTWSHYTLENPYRNRCGIFSEAFYRHLTTNNIVALEVGTPHHEYLLIPGQQNGKPVTFIFDPTAEQLYEKHDRTHFLGTPEELAVFHKQKVTDGHFHELHSEQQRGLGGTYYDGLHVIAMASRVFTSEPVLEALSTFFCPHYRFSPEQFRSWIRNTRSIAEGTGNYAADPFMESPRIDVGAIGPASAAARSTAPTEVSPSSR